MVRYVVFAGQVEERTHDIGRAIGYLEALADNGILKGIARATSHSFVDGYNSDWFFDINFHGDKKIRTVLKRMKLPTVYQIIRAEICDQVKFGKGVGNFQKRFGLEYRTYED